MSRRRSSGVLGTAAAVVALSYFAALSLVFIVVADTVIVVSSIGYAIKHRRKMKERAEREKERRDLLRRRERMTAMSEELQDVYNVNHQRARDGYPIEGHHE